MTRTWLHKAMMAKPRYHEGYVLVAAPDGGRRREHILIAEKALGRRLRGGEQVHHVNGIKTDNRPENLVLCPDSGYHQYLELRTRALDACGDVNWRKCHYCGKWDDPTNLRTLRSRSTRQVARFAHVHNCRSWQAGTGEWPVVLVGGEWISDEQNEHDDPALTRRRFDTRVAAREFAAHMNGQRHSHKVNNQLPARRRRPIEGGR